MESFRSEAVPAPSVDKVELNEVTPEEPPINCWQVLCQFRDTGRFAKLAEVILDGEVRNQERCGIYNL